jgi:hypothetical protein
MTQGFARLAEGIDPLDDRLDGSADGSALISVE